MAGVALRQAEELCVSCGKHLPLSGVRQKSKTHLCPMYVGYIEC